MISETVLIGIVQTNDLGDFLLIGIVLKNCFHRLSINWIA